MRSPAHRDSYFPGEILLKFRYQSAELASKIRAGFAAFRRRPQIPGRTCRVLDVIVGGVPTTRSKHQAQGQTAVALPVRRW
ncbi:hypothetical protein ACTXMG_11540 [Corynebacterium flavescens]|uniref:hypothetical protein n=1 Tax=Corynebacterium flavescens TaxID=28028 RepID=UPI003FD15084